MKDDKLRNQLSKYGDWALVAGASEGLGEAFAKVLASLGKNLILVARRKDLLEKLAHKFKTEYGVECDILIQDLSNTAAHAKLIGRIKERECRLVVYNAAYGPVRPFLNNTEEQLDYHIDLNARSLIKLIWAFAQYSKEKAHSGFLIMSSMAGMRGTQLVAPYAATKAFGFNLGESLFYELKEYGIDVSVLCGGPIKTPNYLKTNPQYSSIKPKEHDPEFVAKEGLNLLGNRAFGLPGGSNRFNDFILSRILPRSFAVKINNNTMRKIYAHYLNKPK